MDISNEISVDVSPKDIEACHGVGVSKNSSKKTIIRFRKHAKKAVISRKNLRKSSLPNCNVFINDNLTVKNNEIAFLGKKNLNLVVIVIKYIQEMEGYIFQVQKYTGNLLKIYHLNDLFNNFPYYEFWGEL